MIITLLVAWACVLTALIVDTYRTCKRVAELIAGAPSQLPKATWVNGKWSKP